ncbi:MAG: hypothetical protein KME57_33400 [Scytonema hyalinum WJT4-NPBG1]|nr:hypothetical protein [Scytonema hyalinum WJT4-NPBG1]
MRSTQNSERENSSKVDTGGFCNDSLSKQTLPSSIEDVPQVDPKGFPPPWKQRMILSS